MVELLDLFPTLTELSGLKNPKGLEGVSHARVVLDGVRGPKSVTFTQHPRPAYFDRTEKSVPEAMGYSVRTLSGRYTEWRDWTTGKLVGAEYYENGEESERTKNLIDAMKDSNELKTARTALHKQFPPDVPPAKR
jgi:hypothetical protein